MGLRPSTTAGLACGFVIGLAGVVHPGPAKADQIDRLQRRVDALQDELQRVKARQSQLSAAQERAEGKTMKLKYKPGLVVESEDGAFKAHLGGRLMVDGAWYDEDKSELGDGTELRRARLFVAGTLYRDWAFKTQWDFADNHVSSKDLYLKYKGLEGFNNLVLTVGQHKEALSLEEQTSTKYITFMERALPNAFLDNVGTRQIGISGKIHGDNWTGALGVFGADIDDDPANEGNEDWGVTGRVTFAPIAEKTRAVHLGGWGSFRSAEDASDFRFRQRPESHLTDARLVDTGSISGSDSLVRWGAELAGIYGPFALQGEYIYASVDATDLATGMATDPDFDGWYVEASYFLTGESRAYHPKSGNFGRVKPKSNFGAGGYGAWQVGARYSTIDLTDGTILGGKMDNVTLGLNWHLNPYVRFMLNLVWVNTDANATGNAANLHAGEATAGDDDPFLVQIRAQVDW